MSKERVLERKNSSAWLRQIWREKMNHKFQNFYWLKFSWSISITKIRGHWCLTSETFTLTSSRRNFRSLRFPESSRTSKWVSNFVALWVFRHLRRIGQTGKKMRMELIKKNFEAFVFSPNWSEISQEKTPVSNSLILKQHLAQEIPTEGLFKVWFFRIVVENNKSGTWTHDIKDGSLMLHHRHQRLCELHIKCGI